MDQRPHILDALVGILRFDPQVDGARVALHCAEQARVGSLRIGLERDLKAALFRGLDKQDIGRRGATFQLVIRARILSLGEADVVDPCKRRRACGKHVTVANAFDHRVGQGVDVVW